MNSNTATILIVDDEKQVRDLLSACIETGGRTVLASASAEEALGLAEQQHVDLVITDLMMPGLNGSELAVRLRESSDVPILLISGTQDLAFVEEALLNVDAFLAKPFPMSDLAAMVDKLLAPHPAQATLPH